MPARADLPPPIQSRSVIQAVRIAPHESGEFGQPWLQEQFAIVLSALNSILVALGAAADDHRIAPIHELQLPPLVLGLQGDLRDVEDEKIRNLRPFLLNLHRDRYGETEDHDTTVINRALAIAGQESPGPFYPAMEFLFAAWRSLDEGRLTHAVLETGTAIELLVSGVIVGIAMEKQWSEEKLENVLSDQTGFRNRYVDHFARAFGITVDRHATGSDPINTWLRVAYPLRNRVAHHGHRPTNAEAIDGVRLASELIDFTGTTAQLDPRFGIKFPGIEELIPAPVLDERSLAADGAPSELRLARDAFAEGVRALDRNDTEAAARAFADADRHGSASGAYNLGMLRVFAGDPENAIEPLRRGAERGHPGAPAYLGVLLLAEGETVEAETLLRDTLGDPTVGPLASYFLATIVGERGDREQAADLYRRAAINDDSPLAAEAAFRRGTILAELGDPNAIDAYRRASELGSPKGATNLGNLLAADGRPEEAKAAHRRAIDLGDPEVIGRAAFNLALLLDDEGRTHAAEAMYRQAAEHGEPLSLLALAKFAARRGDFNAAKELLRTARGSTDGEVSAAAVQMARELNIALD
jgi:TPR repeat protein